MNKLIFEKTASDDLFFWVKNDIKTLKKIINLIESIKKTPFVGTGKPEPLKHELTGYWSRRINKSDRLVYKITNDAIIVASCRYHYSL